MKSAIFLLVAFTIASVHGGIPPVTFVDLAKRGGVLTYDVNVSKCDVKLPDTLPAYSFGDVLNEVYVEYADDTKWRLYTTNERPVNSSRFQTENGAWRITEVEFTPDSMEDGTAVITLTDIEQGAQGKVLATGTITCKISTGGFSVNLQRAGGGDLEHETDVMKAFQRGDAMTFAADLNTCAKGGYRYSRPGASAPLAGNASETIGARIDGYRIPRNAQQGSLEFTAVLVTPKEREVFNVRIQGKNQVEVKAYALTRPSAEPTPVVTYRCHLGVGGSFHIYHT
ncbi:uncharacterized protein [Littorina saxatilis]|uniref:Uncharacterized protein n=1 Tax=Littorina saxatilis TaxID=31220 RepID=A0AAN9BE52_9CAEN